MKKMNENIVVLDTHIWIWLLIGDEKIKECGFLPYINKAVKEYNVKIPAISLWEVSMLVAKNRIVLSKNTLEWLTDAVSAPGLTVYPITPEVAYESACLPENFHGDPADRLIVATARALNGTLLTFDKKILEYGAKGHIKTIIPS
ncbi:hypothetical protein A3J90_01035 [candidate division WOR-1 bacterium RIFOXYC2_FULL_37_10]|uniref:PIN domain-containing protein n=1 Tax=candidate division WOR-1 bacterium RIFOXYB2_FULL_37_13 TaxID=1802579 RepID=A0A1F4SU37_UNCSA|nr:MAG: hypothetical protein A2246_04275 [candidate division WOR-1 bacterium RIFOXYA2_FULL_37_7]OGC23837.1 MAG: hypothetical protein A2310_04240 [candidate division WOR-1 bacterium RIFOXYB2_FULL_37_13]OGC33312.1 MAG: hypothetical protein A3J90_01035 [candidate division WOR-1 bacterium RIFOXYC2_FULL_37_10]